MIQVKFTDLGQNPLFNRQKCWILTAAALAGSAASSIIGGSKAASAARKAKREQTYRSNAEKAWYDKAYNTDYLDTKAGQNLMRRAQDVQNEYVRKADGAAAVGGGTAASTAMAKESANKTIGDAVANIGAADSAKKSQVDAQHLQNQQQLSRERENLENQRAQNISNASQNMSNALMTAAGSLDGTANKQSNSNLGVKNFGVGSNLVAQIANEVAQSGNGATRIQATKYARNAAIPTDPSAMLDDEIAKRKRLQDATGV